MSVQSILPILQTVLATFNILIITYGFYRFLNKPHDTLQGRITVLEDKVKTLEVKDAEHDRSLKQGNDRFRDQREANEAIQKSILALIEFEIQYCSTRGEAISPELSRAKDELHNYLAHK